MSAAMTDIELIGYCEIHCTTERALFSAEHVNRMIELAGNPPGFKRQNGWVSAHAEMQELCDLARARLAPPTAAIAPPVAAGSVDTAEFRKVLNAAVMCKSSMQIQCNARLLAHIDAWGAQQREAASNDLHKLVIEAQDRAEKAEADLKQVNEWQAAALSENQTMGELWAAKVDKAEARIAELEAQLAAAKPYDLKA